MIRIVNLGDSVTLDARNRTPEEEEYYSAMLEARLHDEGFEVEIIPFGKGGESTEGALTRLDDVIALKPDYVTVMYGLNDAFFTEENVEKEQVPPMQYGVNLTTMIHRLQDAGAHVVLLTSNPQSPYGAFGEARINRLPYSKHGDMNFMLQHHVEVMRLVGKIEKVPVLDIYETLFALRIQDDSTLTYLVDGAHLTAAGHRIITEKLMEYFREELPNCVKNENGSFSL